MLKTRELLVAKGTRRRSGAKLTSVKGVTIHNAGNTSRGAGAGAHARLQATQPNAAPNSWHWTVDEKEAVISIPENEKANHAGDAVGNNTTVAIEICDNIDGNLYLATQNGAELAAAILKRQGFKSAVYKENLYQHNNWSGKDCPYEIRRGLPFGWDRFIKEVNSHMTGLASLEYITTRPTQVYEFVKDVRAGLPVALQAYTGGGYALVTNLESENDLVLPWEHLRQKDGLFYFTASPTPAYRFTLNLAAGVPVTLQAYTGGKFARVKHADIANDFIVEFENLEGVN